MERAYLTALDFTSFFLYYVRGAKITDSGIIFGLSHLNHTEEVAPEVPAVDEPEQGSDNHRYRRRSFRLEHSIKLVPEF